MGNSCDKLKKYGYKITCVPTNDETRKDYVKKSAQRAKTLALDAKEDQKIADEKNKVNNKKSQEGQIKAKTERVHIAPKAANTIVGKGGQTAVTDTKNDAVIKTNLDAQSKPVGSGKRVTVALGRFTHSGNKFVEASIDAATAYTNVIVINYLVTFPLYLIVFFVLLIEVILTDPSVNISVLLNIVLVQPETVLALYKLP